MLDQAVGAAQNMGNVGVSMGTSSCGAVRPGRGAVKTSISIFGLVTWAFQRECAMLDFNPLSTITGAGAQVRSMSSMIAEHGRLGCHVDGGGCSDPHPDADAVADALSCLPEAFGGRKMAVHLAELARVGATPDWMQDARPYVRPIDTHTNRHGVHAKTVDAATFGASGWPAQPRRNRKGVIVMDKVLCCPVAIRPMPSDIARARRVYLRWWGALRELRETFRVYGGLTAFVVTQDMPPRAPWEKSS